MSKITKTVQFNFYRRQCWELIIGMEKDYNVEPWENELEKAETYFNLEAVMKLFKKLMEIKATAN